MARSASFDTGRQEHEQLASRLAAAVTETDVICTQGYGRWADEAKFYQRIYDATGKPIFNGDGCFGLADEHQQQWGVKGFRTGATSLKDVATLYEETMTGMMRTLYVIGWHHCGYLQQWDAAERGDSPRNENGFLNPMEANRPLLTDAVKKVNQKSTQDARVVEMTRNRSFERRHRRPIGKAPKERHLDRAAWHDLR